jgi:hypothetical protein
MGEIYGIILEGLSCRCASSCIRHGVTSHITLIICAAAYRLSAPRQPAFSLLPARPLCFLPAYDLGSDGAWSTPLACLHWLADMSLMYRAHREWRLRRAMQLCTTSTQWVDVYRVSTYWLSTAGWWRAARRSQRPKAFSLQLRCRDSNSKVPLKRRLSGETGDHSFIRHVLARMHKHAVAMAACGCAPCQRTSSEMILFNVARQV